MLKAAIKNHVHLNKIYIMLIKANETKIAPIIVVSSAPIGEITSPVKLEERKINERTKPVSDIVFGSQIVNALESSTKSLRTGKRSILKYADK